MTTSYRTRKSSAPAFRPAFSLDDGIRGADQRVRDGPQRQVRRMPDLDQALTTRKQGITRIAKSPIELWTGRTREVTLSSVAVVSLLAVIPYLSTLHSYLLSDDFGLVALYSQKEWAHFVQLFGVPWTEGIYAGHWTNPTDGCRFSYKLDSIFGPGSPLHYHVTNVGLHVLTTLLVLSTARFAAGVTWLGAAFAAALFAVLPTHAETVSGSAAGPIDPCAVLLRSVPGIRRLAARRRMVTIWAFSRVVLAGTLQQAVRSHYDRDPGCVRRVSGTRTEPIQPETAVHLPAVRTANPRAPRATPPPVRAGGPRERNHGRLAAWARTHQFRHFKFCCSVGGGFRIRPSPWGSPLWSPFWPSFCSRCGGHSVSGRPRSPRGCSSSVRSGGPSRPPR